MSLASAQVLSTNTGHERSAIFKIRQSACPLIKEMLCHGAGRGSGMSMFTNAEDLWLDIKSEL